MYINKNARLLKDSSKHNPFNKRLDQVYLFFNYMILLLKDQELVVYIKSYVHIKPLSLNFKEGN